MSKEQMFNFDEGAKKGRVTLVGAGPGAVDLLTIRGQRVLQQAEVVVYDDLANAELLEICPASAKRIYVGKRAGVHCMLQAQISEILVKEARLGKRVVRLKGGDPLVFARGGEEMETLAKEVSPQFFPQSAAFLDLVNSPSVRAIIGQVGSSWSRIKTILGLISKTRPIQEQLILDQEAAVLAFEPDKIIFHIKAIPHQLKMTLMN